MTAKLFQKINLWTPPVVWALVIFSFSSGTVPKASPVYWEDFVVKKFAHVIFFGILALLVYRALLGEGFSRKKSAVIAVLVSVSYGVSDEYHQMFTQGREATVRDVLFDGLGASIAMFMTYNFLQKLPKQVKLFFRDLDIS